jgi:hypothetical protein
MTQHGVPWPPREILRLLDSYDAVESRTGQTMLMPRRGRAPMRLRDAVRD